MKQMISKGKTARQTKSKSQQGSSAGQNAVSIAPPGYGIDFIDSDPEAVMPLQKSSGPLIQAKLKVGQPGDQYEQEADRIVEQVMSMPEPTAQRQVVKDKEEEKPIQAKPLAKHITPLVQMQPEEEEEEELQMKASTSQTSEVTPNLEDRINSIKGGGHRLPESVRAFFEPRFGHDFSQVRTHADTRAMETAQAIKARAFTVGRNVVFGEGQYAPETSKGRHLLAHELSHVVQQEGTEGGRLGNRISRQEAEEAEHSPTTTAPRAAAAAEGRATADAGAVTPAAGLAAGAAADAAAAVMTPLTFNVAGRDLTPKRWTNRRSINAGAASTRTNIVIGGPPNSTIDITHIRQDAPDYGHTHTNEPPGPMARRFKHGHLTNRADGRGGRYNDFQIGSEGNSRTITYHAPHAAGQVLLTAQIRGRTDAASRRQVAVTTAVGGLQQYTPTHPNEYLIPQGAAHSGDDHWGTAATVARMHEIVNDFRDAWVEAAPEGTVREPDNAPTLRISDFSLRHGGIYDFRDNWLSPHRTHRFGNDIDISRTVMIGGVRTWLRPGEDDVGQMYNMLNNTIGVDPEDEAHWHVDV